MTDLKQPEIDVFPDELPLLILQDAVMFPLAVFPLIIGQQSSLQLVNDIMQGNRLLFIASPQSEDKNEKNNNLFFQIGTIAIIRHMTRISDNVVNVIVQGLERAVISEIVRENPYYSVRIETKPDKLENEIEGEALKRVLIDLLRHLIEISNVHVSNELLVNIDQNTELRKIVYISASTIPMPHAKKKEILAKDPVEEKARLLIQYLQREISIGEIGKKITKETEERLTKAQKEHYLREQMLSIQKELGISSGQQEVEELRRKFNEALLPDEARKEAERELSRLELIHTSSPEYGIIRTYLDWMVNLPWNTLTGGTIDLQNASSILNEDHYDLDRVKKRILEYLAVKKLREKRQTDTASSQEPILCFVGPPGVGKTSLGKSISRALGRKFVRISLGGLHDEAEIRGHRRTYIGALPGKIIQGLNQAKAKDLVFMLDEIDKVGSDWRGDPFSALLEVLDPAQNQTFVDNYLSVPFDLSKVIFITTANSLNTIPSPLIDRMEVIELSGYTEDEKVHIATQFLIPKQVMANGLAEDELKFEQKALRHIIRDYTREAGVRNLEREIASICRKIAFQIAENKENKIDVTPLKVEEYLGKPHFFNEVAERTTRPGVATGLAWTYSGGDILFIEATIMPYSGKNLILTGMLGDVMKESARAALSYISSNFEFLNVDPAVLEHKTIHLHIPAGAIPKDGPSAGITIMVALASLLMNKSVHSDVAMTGEITLRGKILPVGGIKEKVLAAHRSEIKTVILPKHNERDLEDIPKNLKDELNFAFVSSAEEALKASLDI